MKKLILFLLLNVVFHAYAEVKISSNDTFSKKEKKTSTIAVKRAASFYTWYFNYLNTNKTKPTKHVVIDQYTTAHLRDEAMNNTTARDAFLGSRDIDNNCQLEIIPKKVKPGRISLLVNVSGAYNYTFYIDMIIQKGNWCIDLVVPEEDLNPAIHEMEE